jgi:hypothetical protein
MRSSRRSGAWLRRAVLIPLLSLGVAGSVTFITATPASAEPNGWCDYVAERGITASSDYWVGYWWKWGHAAGCW